jgi:hypothetical protein
MSKIFPKKKKDESPSDLIDHAMTSEMIPEESHDLESLFDESKAPEKGDDMPVTDEKEVHNKFSKFQKQLRGIKDGDR